MTKKEMMKKIAKLESINDQLSAEIRFLHEVAMQLGFQEGLKTLKEAAMELLKEDQMFDDVDETNPPLTSN